MQSPLVTSALRDQLLQVLGWHQQPAPSFRWGVVIHRRTERSRARFGVVTPSGESLLLSGPLLDALSAIPCWLDGAVAVRLEAKQLHANDAWADPVARVKRAPLVESLAVYLDPKATPNEAQTFKQMAGVLTPATMPSDLFILTLERPAGWPL